MPSPVKAVRSQIRGLRAAAKLVSDPLLQEALCLQATILEEAAAVLGSAGTVSAVPGSPKRQPRAKHARRDPFAGWFHGERWGGPIQPSADDPRLRRGHDRGFSGGRLLDPDSAASRSARWSFFKHAADGGGTRVVDAADVSACRESRARHDLRALTEGGHKGRRLLKAAPERDNALPGQVRVRMEERVSRLRMEHTRLVNAADRVARQIQADAAMLGYSEAAVVMGPPQAEVPEVESDGVDVRLWIGRPSTRRERIDLGLAGFRYRESGECWHASWTPGRQGLAERIAHQAAAELAKASGGEGVDADLIRWGGEGGR